MLWSDGNLRENHSTLAPTVQLDSVKNDKEGFISMLIENYKKKNWLQHSL
jgi:hypothetical protein